MTSIMTSITFELGSDETAEVLPQLPLESNGDASSRGADTNQEIPDSAQNAVGASGHGSSIASIPEADANGDPDAGDGESQQLSTNLSALPEESDHEIEADGVATGQDYDHKPSATDKAAEETSPNRIVRNPDPGMANEEAANQMLHDGSSPVADTLSSMRSTTKNAGEEGSAKSATPLRFQSSEILPPTDASGHHSPKLDRLEKTRDVDKGGLYITPTPPTPSVPRLRLEQVHQPQQWQHLDESSPLLPHSIAALGAFPRGNRGSLEDELMMEYLYEQERGLATEAARHALRDGAGIGSPSFRPLQPTTSPVVASMRGRYTIPYRQVGCQSDGPSGQNLYNAVRPLHVSRKDNDAEAMAQDDPWASSWRRSGQSIGKSPRSSWVAPGGSESYREEMPPRFAEGLSSTLRVKPLLAAAPHEQQGRPKMPTSPRNGNPYRRKRAASMPVSTTLKPILQVEGTEAAGNPSDSFDGLIVSPRFDNIHPSTGQIMGQQIVKPKPAYTTTDSSLLPPAHNFSRYGSSGFASGDRRKLPHESALRQMGTNGGISCSSLELDKNAWRKPNRYTGRMVSASPRHQGPWLGEHATHVHRRYRQQAWNWKTLVAAEEVEIGPGRYENARWPMQPGRASRPVESSIGGGFMSRRRPSPSSESS